MKIVKEFMIILVCCIVVYCSLWIYPFIAKDTIKYKNIKEITQTEINSNIKTKDIKIENVTSRGGIYYQRRKNIIYKMSINDKTILYFKDIESANVYKDKLLEKNKQLKILVEKDIETSETVISNDSVLNITLNGYTPKPKVKKNETTVKTKTTCFPTNSHKVSSVYGNRKSRGDFHSGLDLCGKYGDNIYAYKEGIVVKTQHSNVSYGNMILLKHKDGSQTRYAHLSNINVSQGQTVKCGEIIGKMGSTGNSTGNHLHFEVIINNKAVNPYNYIF